jgi:citrate lyase beta subunit
MAASDTATRRSVPVVVEVFLDLADAVASSVKEATRVSVIAALGASYWSGQQRVVRATAGGPGQ